MYTLLLSEVVDIAWLTVRYVWERVGTAEGAKSVNSRMVMEMWCCQWTHCLSLSVCTLLKRSFHNVFPMYISHKICTIILFLLVYFFK